MRPTAISTCCAALLLATSACEPTPEKIAQWKDTQRGPGKLRELLHDHGKATLRAQAYVALVEISMAGEAARELSGSPPAERQAVVREAVPLFVKLLTSDGTRDPIKLAAKDALFALRADAAEADKAPLDQALIAWTTADLVGRAAQGGEASEKILVTIGKPADERLLALVATDPPGNAQALMAANILGKIGDLKDNARGAELILAAAQKSVTRSNSINDGLLTALGSLGGPKPVAFLVEQGERGPEAVRAKALFALAQGGKVAGDEVTLAAMLRLIADKKAQPKVRDAAFEVAERVGPKAVPKLLTLLASKEEMVRWAAVEAALTAGGPDAVGQVLQALLPAGPYKKEDLQDFVVKNVAKMGDKAVPATKKALSSTNPVARLTAIWVLARIGGKSDASALAALGGDGTKLKAVKGLETTVGSEAKAAMAALQKK